VKLPTYPRTKPSGVEWLGDVPEHWSVKAIKWETPVLRGASPRPIDDPIYFDDDHGEYSWVRISDVTSAGTYLSTTEQKLSRLGSSLSVKLKPGALFLSIAGSVGKPCITEIKCCIHDGFVYFPHFKGDAKFLYYLFASGEPYRGLGKLGTQLNLNTDTVGSIVAGFPDPAEQHAIAAFLDRETGRIDRLVAKKRELIERLKEKRTALISSTVTRGLPPAAACAAGLPANPPLKHSGIEWLEEVPSHWEVAQLRRKAQILDCKHRTVPFIDDGIPLASIREVHGFEVDLTNAKQTSEDEYLALIEGDRRPRIGDIIYSRNATVGDAALVTTKQRFCMGQDVCLIRAPKHHPKYILYLFRSAPLMEQVESLMIGSTFRRINVGQIHAFWICVPPLPEQTAIAAYLDLETAKLDLLVGKVEDAVERLQEYRTALITAAVTGKIDVRKEVAP
jgi:type I restriction enzyme S subunit